MNYTVTQINTYIKNMFTSDGLLNNVYVKGEVSNCKYHTSGHIYFTIKDSSGQLACVMFAGQRRGLTFRLLEGQSVIVYGSISIYERDGKYQLYAREITLDGLGALYQKYEELKRIMELQGLFEETHKKALPKYAKKIGIITAKTGAALQDIINISHRRNPYVQLYLYPSLVQGEGAKEDIVKALRYMDKMNLDVIILGRGGGSIEDLWAFNEEMVVRAVYECDTPIISAVGHETDTTLVDYVSDFRAPTPSAAAEIAVFDYNWYEAKINEYRESLYKRVKYKIDLLKEKTDNYKLRMRHAGPEYKMIQYRQRLIDTEDKMNRLMKQCLYQKRHRLEVLIEKMKGASPLEKLGKGYAYVEDSDGKVINSVNLVNEEDNISLALIDGKVSAKVTKVQKNDVE